MNYLLSFLVDVMTEWIPVTTNLLCHLQGARCPLLASRGKEYVKKCTNLKCITFNVLPHLLSAVLAGTLHTLTPLYAGHTGWAGLYHFQNPPWS